MICHRAPSSGNGQARAVYHEFHQTCLRDWLRTPHSGNKCPFCQSVFLPESIQPILASSLRERVVEQGLGFLRRASRGAYYGGWAWAASQMLVGTRINQAHLLSAIVQGSTLSGVEIPLLIKSALPCREFLAKYCYHIMPFLLGGMAYAL